MQITGTFLEIMNYYAEKDMEFDVPDTSYTFSFCGKPIITDYCMEKYGKLLNAPCHVQFYPNNTDDVIPEIDDTEMCERFAAAWAGYIGDSEYKRLFGDY